MSFELREPIKAMAHERCACGRISLPPTQWDTIGAQLRKWKKPIPHSPDRLAGCEITGQHKMEAAADTRSAERPAMPGAVEPPPTVGTEAPREPDQPPVPLKPPWAERKDETGLFLDLPAFRPEYQEWKRKVGFALRDYLRKHQTFFADDFWKETGLTQHKEVPNAFSGIIRAAEAAHWIKRTPEMRMHYPTRAGQPWGGKRFRIWESLLYPDKELPPSTTKVSRPSRSAEAGRVCSIEGCKKLLRVNNLSGLCQMHRQEIPGRKRDALISEAVRKAAQEGRLVLGKTAEPPATEHSNHGGPRFGAGRRSIEVDLDKVMEMRRRGTGLRNIAKSLGVSRDTLYRRLREAGIPPLATSTSEAGKLGAAARWTKYYAQKEKKGVKEEVKKMENYITNNRLAENVRRSPVTTMKWGRELGFKPALVNGLLGWTQKQAEAITEKVATLKIINSKRTKVKKYTGPTASSAPTNGAIPAAAKKKPEKGKEAPLGRWLKLQLEEAGVTYCLYEKDKGITIRRQRVVEEEEKYE